MTNFFQELRRRNVVRVAGVYAVIGWILAQVANTLEETMNLPEWFDGLIVALLIIGLPIALIFAWAFELTPEGVKRTEAVTEGESITAETGRKLDYSIVVGLVVLAGLIIWQQSSGPRPAETGAGNSANTESNTAAGTVAMTSVAVLPFADLSPDSDQEYFSDGISEEILNVLVGIEGLDVVSRTSSFQFKGRDLGIPDIAAQLKVRHVVEGSVRKAGSTIRITAQLIDAQDDRHLWSETYDRPLTAENIFSIQDEIARSIVNALRDTLGLTDEVEIDAGIPTESLTAYDLYLQARPLFQARKDLDAAELLLTRALELDPGFAKAWEMRAMLQILIRYYGYSTEPLQELHRRAIDFAQRALAIEANSASAILVQAKVQVDRAWALGLKQDIAAIIMDFNRAVELEPRNATALNWRGLTLMIIGDLQGAMRDFAQCIQHEPSYMACQDNRNWVLAAMGRDEEALQSHLLLLDRGIARILFTHLPVLARLDEELAFKTTTNADGFLAGWRGHDELYRAYQDPGADHQELIGSIQEFVSEAPTVNQVVTDFMLGPLGAFELIEDTIVIWDPGYAPYRQSTQFREKILASGVFEYWDVHGFPPQCQPVGPDDFICP